MNIVSKQSTLRIAWIVFGLMIFILAGCGGEEIPSRFEFSNSEADQGESFIIGQIPSRSVIELIEERRPFTRSLSRALDRDVQLRVADSYRGIIDQMAEEEFDLVFLGPLAYVEAVDSQNAPYQPLARPVRFGSADYHSIIFTHRDNGVQSLGDLKGKTMAFVDPNSTSGYLFPRALMIEEAGLDPMKDLNRVEFLGGHDRVVEAVARGTFTAGAVYDDARSDVLEESKVEQVPILSRSRPIPSEPVVIREDLPASSQDALKQYFLSIDEENPDVMKVLGSNIERFIGASDQAYDDVRVVINTLRRADDS